MTLADQIREFVERRYVVPARKAGRPTLTVTVGDVHREMHLQSRAPAVCGALRSKILHRLHFLQQLIHFHNASILYKQ